MTANPIHALYAELRRRGVADPRALLPDWWDDEAAMDPVGFTEALWRVAQQLAPTLSQAGDLSVELRAAVRAQLVSPACELGKTT